MGRRGGKSADVRSLDALRDARYALAEFRTTVRLALQEASSEVHRTLWWLEHDQLTHWKAQIKRRERLLQDARTELNRAQIGAMDSQVTPREEIANERKANQALAEAQDKVRRIGHWARTIEHERNMFNGQLQILGRSIDGSLPKAEARIDLMAAQLEQYIQVSPSPAGGKRQEPKDEGTPPGKDAP